jgi:hypothetical protein
MPAQILWLKTLINLLYSFGRAAQPGDTLYNWHVWMTILLSASVCAMININPYLNPIDQVTFSRTVWRLYGAKGLVMWYWSTRPSSSSRCSAWRAAGARPRLAPGESVIKRQS